MIDSEILLSEMGLRIVERRKQLNLSQAELAEKAEISVQMLSTAERGAKAIRPINLLKISQALGVSTDYLLTGAETCTDNFILENKLNFWNWACEFYGHGHMVRWHNDLPLTIKEKAYK